MHSLWPEPGEVDDVAARVAAEPRPVPADRPWVLVNMITSLDGAIAIDGRSGGLGQPADKAVFSALRAVADVVLVGAGTARAEGYGPARPTAATREARRARGQAEVPRIAVVTASVDLDLGSPLFADAELPTVVITHRGADPARVAAASEVAEVLLVGDDEVDLSGALRTLRAGGASVVACEGGPRLNGDLIAAGLVDEWDLSVAPLLVGGDAGRAARGPADHSGVTLELARVWEGDGLLLTRWVRPGTG
ncbi:MAG: pyrimidine reductase family protein [Acidimicrobiales bacterium]